MTNEGSHTRRLTGCVHMKGFDFRCIQVQLHDSAPVGKMPHRDLKQTRESQPVGVTIDEAVI